MISIVDRKQTANGTLKKYVADTYSEMENANDKVAGDIAYCIETKKWYMLSDSLVWTIILNDMSALATKAPISHAAGNTTYGVGTTENYGHNKVINDLAHDTFANGESLSAYMGYLLQTNKQNNLNLGSGWATALKAALTASITELNFCDGVTSAIQTQLNAKIGVIANSFASSGYIKFSNGLIIQWGQSSLTAYTLPIAFSNANYTVVACTNNTRENASYDSEKYRPWANNTIVKNKTFMCSFIAIGI